MSKADNNHDAPPLERRQVWLLAGAFEGGMAIAAVLVGWLVSVPPWRHLPNIGDAWSWALGVGLGIAATLPMLALLFVTMKLRVAALERIERLLDEVVRQLFGKSRLIDVAAVCAMAGLGEELLFRGLMQDVLTSAIGLVAGVAAASAIFGLVHPFTAAYVAIAALIGVYFSWLRLATDGLLAPIVAHAAYDFVALVYFLRWRAKVSAAPAVSKA